ncbi:MAG: family 10 glycosylhydrolase [Bacteroidales bacterium]|nr:family 10 glycosylhydrolase [Bacteroidales bacterium]
MSTKKIAKIIFSFLIIFPFLTFSQEKKVPEFRGVWVTTVKMLDYPSKRNLSSEQLKAEYIRIADSCLAIGANAIIFQIRPAADAFYDSPYELWSEWLTGRQGRAPDPYFDPLEFMIEETHKRGMEFHAWINPYRAIATTGHANIAPNHITKLKPQWFFDYDVNRYFDPGIPEARQYIVMIISDIVRRYDIDGIHFDDYFYPYPVRNEQNQIIDIPDYNTYKKYGKGFSNIKDWRRNNINMLVMEVHDSIQAIKPWVRFGISPPGVWRNKGYDPEGSATLGLAAYDWLYADVLLWLQHRWVDYVAPQLYWEIGHPRADFNVLVNWWDKHTYGVDLYIGLNINGIDATRQKKDWGNPNQVPRQIQIANSYSSVKGFILYRYGGLSKNPLGIKDSLRNNYFKVDSQQVILAQNSVVVDTHTYVIELDTSSFVVDSEIDTIAPKPPINVEKFRIGNQITIVWDDFDGNISFSDTSNFFIVYAFEGKKIPETLNSSLRYKVVFENHMSFERQNKWQIFGKIYTFVVTAVDNAANESKPSKPVYIRL